MEKYSNIQEKFCGKDDDSIAHKNERVIVSDLVANNTSVIQDKKLLKFDAQCNTGKLKVAVSTNFEPKLNYAELNGDITSEKQNTLNSSNSNVQKVPNTAQDNTVLPIKTLINISSSELKTYNINHNEITVEKEVLKEEDKNDPMSSFLSGLSTIDMYSTEDSDDTMYEDSTENISSEIQETVSYYKSKVNVKHNHISVEKKVIKKEEVKNDITSSIITDLSVIDISSMKDADVIMYENSADISSETQETVSICKSKSKHKMESKKCKVSEFLNLSQPQQRNITMNQADISTQMEEKDKINAYVTTMKKELIIQNISEEQLRNNEKLIINDIIKKINNKSRVKNVFKNYIPIEEMTEILKNQTSDNIQYVKGHLRINPRYYYYAYLSMGNKERDLFINGPARNRAFDGDLVVASIDPPEDWVTLDNGEKQKTGAVVCILEKVHSRNVIGRLVQHVQDKKPFVVIKPRDQRIPLIRIPHRLLPSLYHSEPTLYENTLLFVNIYSWTQPYYALGKILYIVGKVGDINVELKSILLENNLEILPYRQELLRKLPYINYAITDIDIKNREDWRHECVFTIDPITAVDLDDAVSCKVLNNGNYEIGVHISDVTHYLEFFSPLDIEISKRATSIYLPHMSYHMLPEQLCRICTLLPDKDKLTFSVIWEMTPNAEIVKHRFAKTIIRSCCQMSYESAQMIIENPEKAESENILDIKGNHTMSSLFNAVNNLFKLSVILRKRRFANGALQLDQPKIYICMNPIIQKHGINVPVDYYLEKKTDSNRLIEEFMLLANMTVATHLYRTIPETALLRVHNDPLDNNLAAICELLKKYGIHLNVETPGTLFASIERYKQNTECNCDTVENCMNYIIMVITNMCSRTMARAEYKCASTVTSFSELKHYALNTPLYTHFTSPIRRYSDCVVHRLLFATLENRSLPQKWTAYLCSKIAANCNVKKYSAKLAQEQSTEIFFAYMVSLAGGFNSLAIVLNVKERNIDVILCDTGIKLNINFKDIEKIATVEYSVNFSVPTITVNWKTPPTKQKINMFTLVHVRVEKISEEFRLKAILQQ